MTSRHSLVILLLLLVLLPAGVVPAAAQSGMEIMKRQRDLQRVRDEEERQVLKLVSKSGATKESSSTRPIRDGLKSWGPTMAHEVAMTTSSPSAAARRHSCSAVILLRA